MANEIISEMRGQSLLLTFNRPDRGNALNLDMATQLFNLLKPVTTDRGIRAVVLRGAGGSFMNGIEMNMFAGDLDRALGAANQLFQPYHSVIRELQAMDKPVLAVVDGMVSGAGLSFMLASDLVLAGHSAKFNCQFTSYGMSPDGGASFYLTRKVGAAKATELLMLSETFDAEQAEKLHLVNAVIDDDKLQAEALLWADRLAKGPTRSYAAVKKLVSKAMEQDLNAQLGLEHTYWGATTRGFDFREAVRATFAKREIKFTGA